jgi:hypothetical protein
MSFLDDTPDLSGQRFTSDDLRRARDYFLSALSTRAPSWLREPRGTLALHWNSGGQYPACFLIRIAQIFYVLDRSITKQSVPVLHEKFRCLLEFTGAQFDELLAELEIAAALVERFSPIMLEPLVPISALPGAKPKSPDFALRVHEGDVCIEATVLRVGLLDQWDREATWLAAELSRLSTKRDISTAVEFKLPILFSRRDIPGPAVAKLFDSIGSSPTGEAVLATPSGDAFFSWTPPRVFSLASGAITEVTAAAPLPAGVSHSISMTWLPIMNVDLTEQLTKSVRNTLDKKRAQRVFKGPYLIAIKLGHHRLQSEGIKALLAQRFWPNKQYEGISGVVHYTSAGGFGIADPPHSLWLQPNDDARIPIPTSFLRCFKGELTIHHP